ncbi:aspartate ammonia-lyase [Streptomyces sp. 110]|uniref:Aspartate ammonia-lyase n=1 Tax=Streptomyces endocoffeicus TaxID=2898945 RepID=A0ABS1Q1R1_9ACTN|nr:lyase family protein [Streptomyces endocoffeicus]MBL1118611.1 aspartate ammonia-lyase [Streptomyces endocoffeicus]
MSERIDTETPMWGKVTSLALQNSPAHGLRLWDLPEFIRAFAEVKHAAAHANRTMGLLDDTRASAIADAAVDVARGGLLRQFPLRVVATGGGTATNMNVNEVLAARAGRHLPADVSLDIHPNDHVNRSQSSNDAYPTAVKILLSRQALDVAAALRDLAGSFRRQAERHDGLRRLGRTAWQDAVMVSVSDMHEAHATAADRFAAQFEAAAQTLHVVPLGGTVLGTGVGAPDGFTQSVVEQLAGITGLPLTPSACPADAFAHADGYATLADIAARCAAILAKQCEDLRILSSGPNGGLSEIKLPTLQPGSSIMPGKVNPVVPTMVIQASFSIRAAATAVGMAVVVGEPDINPNTPAVVASLSPALTELAAVIPVFIDKCVDGIAWNRERLAALAARPFDSLITEAEEAGYDVVADSTVS